MLVKSENSLGLQSHAKPSESLMDSDSNKPKRFGVLPTRPAQSSHGYRVRTGLRPQLLSADGLLTVVRSTFAAS